MKLYNKNGLVIGEIYEENAVVNPEPESVDTYMYISEHGLSMIEYFEGFRSNPYLCPAGVPTIGFGTTVYPNGTRVTMQDKSISENEARQMLREQVNKLYGDAVNRLVYVPLYQYQFDALSSFTYNLGEGNLKSSTLLKRVNENRHLEAADEFLKWVYANGEVMQGLVNRREAERKMYLS